jgi:hypothetical protein
MVRPSRPLGLSKLRDAGQNARPQLKVGTLSSKQPPEWKLCAKSLNRVQHRQPSGEVVKKGCS